MTEWTFMISEPKTERDDLINPYWIEDKDLKRGEVDYLSGQEIQFWKDLLAKYLHPIDENKEQQVSSRQHLFSVRYVMQLMVNHHKGISIAFKTP